MHAFVDHVQSGETGGVTHVDVDAALNMKAERER